MDGECEEIAPQPGEHGKHQNTASPHQYDIAGRNGEHIAEKERQEIEAHPGHQACDDEAEGQCGLRQDAEQSVDGEFALRTQEQQCDGHGHGCDDHAECHIDAGEKPEADAEQCRMRERLAEIGHAPPDDEAADRSGDAGKPDPGDQRTDEEGFGEEGHASLFSRLREKRDTMSRSDMGR